MANLTKSLVMPNGQEYEFVGKHWYGTCSTAAATTGKTVNITGFTSADLVTGVEVTVQFENAQSSSSSPTLNVSNTGYYTITGSMLNEWNAGSVLTFVFISSSWKIINGQRATTTYWGKTKLSNSIGNDDNSALTPKAVYEAGYVNAAGAAAAAPVQSVNGQTGAVSLTIPTVPTNVSAFTNDAGYITSAALPTKVSDLTNDSGYLTLATLPIWDGGVI